MTILSAVRDACLHIGVTQPDVLFAGTDRTAAELREAVMEAADAIRDDFDWQQLKSDAYTITGDGSYTSFDLPSDYARMLKVSRLWPSDEPNSPLTWVTDTDKWLSYEVQDIETVTRRATMYGNKIHISPTLESGVTVRFIYIMNKMWSETGTVVLSKAVPTADTDSFFLGDRLLKLSMVWRWKKAKGRAYEADKQDYDLAIDIAAGNNRGSRVIHIGRNRMPSDAVLSYPRPVGV